MLLMSELDEKEPVIGNRDQTLCWGSGLILPDRCTRRKKERNDGTKGMRLCGNEIANIEDRLCRVSRDH